MPVLKKNRDTVTIKLKSIPDGEVTLYASQNYGDFLAVQRAAIGKMKVGDAKSAATNEADIGTFMETTLTRMIVSWNLTDENGTTLPVTLENIDLLDKDDALLLFNTATENAGLPQDEKSVDLDTNS